MKRSYFIPILLVLSVLCYSVASGGQRVDTTPPSVLITSPVTGTEYTTAGSVTITASAADNRKVKKVEFYDNGALKGTDSFKPFTYTWTCTSADNGTHSWTAKAYDAAGNSTTSTAVSLTVNIGTAPDTTPPTPGLVTASNTQFGTFVSSPFNLTTSFTDNESAVTGCEYSIDGGSTWLAATVSGGTPSFTCTKTGINGTNGQVLTLTMRATSSGGIGTVTAVTRTVDAAAPTTTSNAPATWAATDQTVSLTASDGSGSSVANTQYCTDTTNSCTPSTIGTSVAVSCAAGSVCQTYVRYRSTDNVRNVEAINSALVRIDKAAPSVTITTPTTALTWSTSSSPVTLGGTATDTVGVTSVTWSNAATAGSGAAAGTTSWSASVPLNAGSNVITVTAKDAVNNSATATLTVTYTAPDTTPPTPGLVTASTQFGTFVSSPFNLTTSFTDNESTVTGCEYSINGGSTWLAATVSGGAPSFTCTKTGITGTNGQVLALTMRATSSGGTGTATAVTRTVDAAAPTTTSNAPTSWVATDQTVTLTASDGTGSGVASTQYCTDTTNTCAPATTGTSVSVSCAAGSVCQTYVRYRSTDNVNTVETTSSALVRIDKAPPSVSITIPTTASTWSTSSSPLALGGTASDTVGVTSVTWSNAATASSGAAAGTTSWSASVPLNAGSNLITVTAKDAANNSATATLTVTYTAPDTTPPTPGLVTASNTQFGTFVSSPFNLTTTFTDYESAVTGCEYTINGGGTWFAATVSGSAPSFTCTKIGITAADGQVLALNMRATSSGGTGTATAVTRTVDAVAPAGSSLTATPGNTQVALSWSGFSDSGSGLGSYKLVFSTTGLPASSCTSGTPVPGYSGSGTSYTHTGLTNGTTYYYRVCPIDNVGNIGVGATAQATPQGSTFDYSLSNSGNISVTQGSAGSTTITTTLTSGTAQSVTLSASGLPSGTAASFVPNTGTPTFSSTLSISTTSTTPLGTSTITVTGSPLSKTTTPTTLTLTVTALSPTPPRITSQPVSVTVAPLTTATFSVTASGTAPLSYQWQKNSVNISGATGSSYTTPPTTTADSGVQFRCVVSNSGGNVTSNAATLTVTGGASGGQTIWAKHFGGTGGDGGYEVAIDKRDNSVLLTGMFQNTVDFGGGPITTTGVGAFVAKYTASGSYIWAKGFTSTGDININAITIDSTGNVIITGSFKGTVDFGGGPLNSFYSTVHDILIVKFSPSGTHLWSKHFGTGIDNTGNDVTTDNLNNVIVTGRFIGFINFGGGTVQSYSPNGVTFVAKYSADGAYLWAKTFRSTGADGGDRLAVDYAGNLIVFGSFMGYFDCGGGWLPNSVSLATPYLTKLSADGNFIWVKVFICTSSVLDLGLAVDSGGNMILTGSFAGTIDFGGGPLSSAGLNIFVAKYSTTGGYVWAKSFGNTGYSEAYDVAVDSADNAIVTGYFTGSVDFGGGPLTSAGSYDVFVAKYSPNGTNLWSRDFGSTGADIGYAVAVDSGNNVIATGYFQGTVDFGSGALTSAGSYDIFLTKLSQ